MAALIALAAIAFVGFLIYAKVSEHTSAKRDAEYKARMAIKDQQEQAERQERLRRFPDRDLSTRVRVTKRAGDLEPGDIVRSAAFGLGQVMYESESTTNEHYANLNFKHTMVFGFTQMQGGSICPNLMYISGDFVGKEAGLNAGIVSPDTLIYAYVEAAEATPDAQTPVAERRREWDMTRVAMATIAETHRISVGVLQGSVTVNQADAQKLYDMWEAQSKVVAHLESKFPNTPLSPAHHLFGLAIHDFLSSFGVMVEFFRFPTITQEEADERIGALLTTGNEHMDGALQVVRSSKSYYLDN